eukprot:Nk52_evm70s210 gene=Nk52_evmTU70s210
MGTPQRVFPEPVKGEKSLDEFIQELEFKEQPFIIADTQGKNNGLRIEYVSVAFKFQTGFNSGELLGEVSDSKLFNPEDVVGLYELIMDNEFPKTFAMDLSLKNDKNVRAKLLIEKFHSRKGTDKLLPYFSLTIKGIKREPTVTGTESGADVAERAGQLEAGVCRARRESSILILEIEDTKIQDEEGFVNISNSNENLKTSVWASAKSNTRKLCKNGILLSKRLIRHVTKKKRYRDDNGTGHITLPWHCFYHQSFSRGAWDWVVLLFVIYSSISVPYYAAFDVTPILAMDVLTDVVFWLDIIINFRTTYQDESGTIVTSPMPMAKHYLKGWFVIDLFATLPFEFIVTGFDSQLFSLLKIFRVLRLGKVVAKIDRQMKSSWFQLMVIMASFTMLSHWMGCIWFAIGNSQENQGSWIRAREHEAILRAQNLNITIEDFDNTVFYIDSLYFALTSLTTVGFGNIAPETQEEKIFSICSMILGAFVYASVFGNVTAVMDRLHSTTTRYRSRIAGIDEFIRFHKLPKDMQKRIHQYAEYSWQLTQGIDMNSVLMNLSDSLRSDVTMYLYKHLIHCSPLFRGASEGCIRSVAMKLQTMYFAPEDWIIREKDAMEKLYFISKGNVEVIVGYSSVATLGPGDFFGEMSLEIKSSGRANAGVRCISFSDLHSLDHKHLIEILRKHRDFMPIFKRNLKDSYSLRSKKDADKTKSELQKRDTQKTSAVLSLTNLNSNSSDEAVGSIKFTKEVGINLRAKTESNLCANAIQETEAEYSAPEKVMEENVETEVAQTSTSTDSVQSNDSGSSDRDFELKHERLIRERESIQMRESISDVGESVVQKMAILLERSDKKHCEEMGKCIGEIQALSAKVLELERALKEKTNSP